MLYTTDKFMCPSVIIGGQNLKKPLEEFLLGAKNKRRFASLAAKERRVLEGAQLIPSKFETRILPPIKYIKNILHNSNL